jgi:hypothetical protein
MMRFGSVDSGIMVAGAQPSLSKRTTQKDLEKGGLNPF